MTSLTQRITSALTRSLEVTPNPAGGYESHVTPPSREGDAPLSLSQAAVIPSVYRALQIITGSASQLPLDVERGGHVLTGRDVPSFIRRPNLDLSRSEFIGQLVTALATTGNAYIYREGGAAKSETANLVPLAPHLVTPWKDDNGKDRYNYDGHTYGRDRIIHLRLLTLPGSIRGIGPIQAAQATMSSTSAMRSYAAQWWDHGHPSGILTTETPLNGDEARRYRNAWNYLDEDGQPLPASANPSRIRVLGKGLKYEPLLISPKDALWLEAQAFDTLEIARVFGVPASLMLTTPDGGSMTYANVEQEWLGFVRFTLMSYLRAIEEALTDLTANGQVVRFNIEGLLRADTSSRYAAHAQAIDAGFMTIDEIRAIEHLPPLETTTQPTPIPVPAATQEATA